ncbi:MAG: hypothetical protein SOY88_00140 [Massilioclostridium sp.]|nr:hypothetical protein [Massilioclostridium sp.]
MLTRLEKKILRRIVRRKKLSVVAAQKILHNDYDGVMLDLQEKGLIEQEIVDNGPHTNFVPVYSERWIPSNRYNCKKEIKKYNKDMRRTWYPHIISTIALAVAIAAFILSLIALSQTRSEQQLKQIIESLASTPYS